MLKLYRGGQSGFASVDGTTTPEALGQARWIDLSDATAEEKRHVEETLNVDVDPINDYEPYEISTHFSAAGGQLTVTGLVLLHKDNAAHLAKVIFIRAKDKLITVSDRHPDLLPELTKECERFSSKRAADVDDVFAAILDAAIDHTDNILDDVGHDLETINNRIFQYRHSAERRRLLMSSPRRRNRQLEDILTTIGLKRDVLVKLRRSVLSFRRMVSFLRDQDSAKTLMPKLKAFERNLQSIEEAETDLSATANFLLDGVVGYIDLLQNRVMSILTLVTLILTPAMVVASIYGMNFKIMPELQWTYGYPYAIGLIVASTAALYLWVRARGL
ncbi:MAG: Magnesium and cobalt transport protein CorA [Pseudolabrys sp.]|nr:Magnesium and cobalt transport protein CorA [Pseudolabrys sp.]